MNGVRSMDHEAQLEVLRWARAGRLAQAPKEDYSQAIAEAESTLGIR